MKNATIYIETEIKTAAALGKGIGVLVKESTNQLSQRIFELENKRTLISIEVGDISSTQADANSQTTNNTDNTDVTITVPVSIFLKEEIELLALDEAMGIADFAKGLSKIAAGLNDLEFLNG